MFPGAGSAVDSGTTGTLTRRHPRPLNRAANADAPTDPNAHALDWLNTTAEDTYALAASAYTCHRLFLRSSASLAEPTPANVHAYDPDNAATAVAPFDKFVVNRDGNGTAPHDRPFQCASNGAVTPPRHNGS